jgi:hypothetical protein
MSPRSRLRSRRRGSSSASRSSAREIENSVDEEVFTVALACGEDDDLAVVDVIAWPNEGALRQFEVQSRPSSREGAEARRAA